MIAHQIKPGWWMGRARNTCFFGKSHQEIREKYLRWLMERPEEPKARPKHRSEG